MSPALTHNEGHRLSPAKQAGYRNAKKVHSREGLVGHSHWGATNAVLPWLEQGGTHD